MTRPLELGLDNGKPPVRDPDAVPGRGGDLRESLRLARALSVEIRALTASIRDRSPAPKLRGDDS